MKPKFPLGILLGGSLILLLSLCAMLLVLAHQIDKLDDRVTNIEMAR